MINVWDFEDKEQIKDLVQEVMKRFSSADRGDMPRSKQSDQFNIKITHENVDGVRGGPG